MCCCGESQPPSLPPILASIPTMEKRDRDPDVVRWGLDDLFEGLPMSDGDAAIAYRDSPNADDGAVENGEVVGYGGGLYGDDSVENDEIIAHALQEEYSQFDDDTGNEGGQQVEVVGDGTERTSTSSSLGEKLYEGEMMPSEIVDEASSLDSEVSKRMNQLVPVPHVPKINSDIPSDDEATSDHQRLLDRLCLYELFELKVQGDGNCQFRALSDQLYRTPEHHKFVREQVVSQLKAHPEIYEGYVPMAYSDYLKKISKCGEWGDHVTLQAAADKYGVKIFVLTSFKDTCYIEILPNIQKSKRVIFLSFWAEVHYNSIYPEGELPTLETKKKKTRWWHLGYIGKYILS